MSIKRLGLSNPAANTNTTIAIVTEPHLASVIATNKSDTGPALITIWVVPVGATQESQYSYITYNLELSEGNSFETHRFAMNQSDTLRVKSSTSEVSFIASGVPQTATPSTDSSQIFTNKTISGLTNTLTDIGNSSLVNDSFVFMGEDIELGETVANLDYFQFDTAATPTASAGRLIWDNGDGTLSLGLKGGNVNLPIGQEQVALCYNGTGATLTKGTVVYVTGSQGQRPSLAKSNASSESTSSKTFGIVTENIANGAEGFVTTFGVVRGLNTLAFAEGAPLWLSTTAGLFTQTMPTQPNHSVFIGYCIRSHASSGQVFVKIQNGYELQELHNVLITDPANGQGLVYESSTGLWKNQNIDAFPLQTGNNGKILSTNGSTVVWRTATVVLGFSTYSVLQSSIDTYSNLSKIGSYGLMRDTFPRSVVLS